MKLFIAMLVTMFSFMSYAQTRIVSIDAFDYSYTGGLSFKHDKGADSDRDTTTFKFNLNYAQNLEQYAGLMWKAQAYWNRADENFGKADTLISTFGAAGGILYNFQPEDIKNSIMAGAMVGLERAAIEYGNQNEKTGFNMFLNLEAGKRWDMGSYSAANISYAPTVSFQVKRYGGGIRDDYFKSGTELRLNFLKFDILF